MIKNNYLFRNITVLNMVLAVIIVLMFIYLLSPFFPAPVNLSIPSLGKTREQPEGIPSGEHVLDSPPDYALIAEENLFHPERKIPPEKKAGTDKELPKPEFVLYGTLQTDDMSIAYIEDMKAPKSTAGRGRRQTILHKGESLSGYTLKEVSIDRIVMARGDEDIIVRVIDPRQSKHGVASSPNTKTATVSASQTASPRTTPQSVGRVQQPPSPQSLIKPEPLTKKRAPMNPSDAKVRDFFLRPQ
ncbi:MAG: hypothetical protein ACOYVJ_12435 [Nitrospirota bacterium]